MVEVSTKELITKAGLELFAKNSYADVSVDHIVTKAGISKGSFYYYFKSKDEFYKHLLGYAFSNFIAIYQQRSKNKKNKEDLLHAFCDAFFQNFEEDKNAFFLIQKELVKIVIGDESDFLPYHKKVFELLSNILNGEEYIISFYVMGILRSSIIFHLKTSTPLELVSQKAWAYIKKIVNM